MGGGGWQEQRPWGPPKEGVVAVWMEVSDTGVGLVHGGEVQPLPDRPVGDSAAISGACLARASAGRELGGVQKEESLVRLAVKPREVSKHLG